MFSLFIPKAKDPVCGMKVSKDKNTIMYSYHKKDYYFCSDHCKKQFEQEPDQYVKKESTSEHDCCFHS